MLFSEEDLITCDTEPIHIPGFIQSHGFLLALDPRTLLIDRISENSCVFLHKTAEQLLGKSLTEVFNAANASFLLNAINVGLETDNFEILNPASFHIEEAVFEVIFHSNADALIIEFEESSEISFRISPQRFMISAFANIPSARSVRILLNNVALLVKEISGFDRVMVYQFHEDGHGEVVSEAKNPALIPYLNLHYPSSDIPAQAKELYRINHIRLIADVHSAPSPLIGIANKNKQPLDLTQSVLRAVSPIHIEYLKNMGVSTSFSISLIYRKKLWGLIACHNYEVREMIDYGSRIACRFIGQLFSAALELRIEEDLREEKNKFEKAEALLHKKMLESSNIADALTGPGVNMTSINHASGAALFYESNMYTVGKTPKASEIIAVAAFVVEQGPLDIFHLQDLPMKMEGWAAQAASFSGIMMIPLANGTEDYIIWFKPELIETIDWAGNPDKSTMVSKFAPTRLSPRTSFEKWSVEKRYHSAEWSAEEVGTAEKLRTDILTVLSKKSADIKKRNDLLQTAYDDLDSFSYTISHDLRTPLASIKIYTELLLEEYYEKIPREVAGILRKVLGSASRMNNLINNVLQYSKANRTGVTLQRIGMPALLSQLIQQVREMHTSERYEIKTGAIYDICGDPTMVMQIFQNLIGNAVKYSAEKKSAVIEISSRQDEANHVIYSVSDNGIGFDMKYADEVFELFHRLDQSGPVEGSGIGLAIVKKLVARNGGRIWVESVPDKGTTFYVSLLNETTDLSYLNQKAVHVT